MKLSLRNAAPLAAAAALAFGLLVKEGEAEAQMIQIAPPPMRFEVMPPAPSVRHVWLPGYWGYRRGYGVEWVGGRWDMGRPGHEWIAPQWVPEGRRWHFSPGRWHRR